MSVTISGKININGVETEFEFDADNGSWSQWGGTVEQLGARVEYLEAMERGLAEDTDYYNQPEDEKDAPKFQIADRVVWSGDGEDHYGVILTNRDENDAYQVAFDDFPGKDTPAYEEELRAAD